MPNLLAISQYRMLPLIPGVVCQIDTILDTTKASNVGLPPEPEGRVSGGIVGLGAREARYDE